MDWLDSVKWNHDGLVPVIAHEVRSGDVLMLAFMNREALALTAERGQAVYWSRSRARLWHKGEASGHFQQVHEIRLDCDADVVLLEVSQLGRAAGLPGIACHTGRHSCFFRRLEGGQWQVVDPVLEAPEKIYPSRQGGAPTAVAVRGEPLGEDSGQDVPAPDLLARLAAVIESRQPGQGGDPATSYVARLFAKGTDAILKKVGEEATEVVMAAKDGVPAKIVYEVADLWFHSMIALAAFGLKPADVLAELARREGVSGIEEFALRKVRQREQEGS